MRNQVGGFCFLCISGKILLFQAVYNVLIFCGLSDCILSILYVNKSDMNLIKFTEESPDEALCKAHFRAQREQEALTCRKCGGTHQYWLEGKPWGKGMIYTTSKTL